jgi:hypothetical protein
LPIFPENNPMNIIGKGELQQFDFVCSAHELLTANVSFDEQNQRLVRFLRPPPD